MKLFLFSMLATFALNAFAIPCDCEVRVYSPMTGSHKAEPKILKAYTLEEYASYSGKNQKICKNTCQREFEKDITTEELHALLLTHAKELIQDKSLGYNCTGLTTIKFPVRVKASLGLLGLGNVFDTVEVITHEEICFTGL